MDFLTPVGRLVQGNPIEAQTKNMQGQPLMTRSGQPTQKYFVAVAFKKTDQAFAAFYAQLVAAAKGGFPTLFDAAGNCTHPRFAWKIADGDGMDDNGKPNANKTGFAGCWVVKFSTTFPPRCFYAGRYQPHEQITDEKAIPRGYYVRISGSVEGNADAQKPGLYVNMSMLELVGGSPSDIISTGPDASQVFGGQAAALPPGVSAVVPSLPQSLPGTAAPPLNFAALMPSGLPQIPGVALSMPGGPVATALPMVAPASVAPLPVTPNPGFLVGPGGLPPAPTALAAPPAPAAPQMTAKAGGFTREQYLAQGWTDETLRANGMMI